MKRSKRQKDIPVQIISSGQKGITYDLSGFYIEVHYHYVNVRKELKSAKEIVKRDNIKALIH